MMTNANAIAPAGTLSDSGAGDEGTLPRTLAELLEGQYYVITRRQALRYGITDSGLRHRLKPGGNWQKILPGVYSTLTGPVTADQKQMAALLYAGPKAVLTGAWAVRRHHLDCPGLNEILVIVPAKTRVKSFSYVQIQRTSRMPAYTSSTKGIRFAPLVRAVGDAARSMLRREDVQALVCAAVQKGRCSLSDLIAELNAGPTTGSALLRMALGELAAGVRSEGERDLKVRISRSDLEQPMYNARLYLPDGTFLAIVDTWWQRAGVAGEVDSRQYHMQARDYRETMNRHNRIEAAGVHLLHFLPMDIRQDWPTVHARIRDAIANGKRNPPLPIIAVPHDVTDVIAYLASALAPSLLPA